MQEINYSEYQGILKVLAISFLQSTKPTVSRNGKIIVTRFLPNSFNGSIKEFNDGKKIIRIDWNHSTHKEYNQRNQLKSEILIASNISSIIQKIDDKIEDGIYIDFKVDESFKKNNFETFKKLIDLYLSGNLYASVTFVNLESYNDNGITNIVKAEILSIALTDRPKNHNCRVIEFQSQEMQDRRSIEIYNALPSNIIKKKELLNNVSLNYGKSIRALKDVIKNGSNKSKKRELEAFAKIVEHKDIEIKNLQSQIKDYENKKKLDIEKIEDNDIALPVVSQSNDVTGVVESSVVSDSPILTLSSDGAGVDTFVKSVNSISDLNILYKK